LRWDYTRVLFLAPLLFIIVLEALSREFRTGIPWELRYADDLALVADTLEGCLAKLKAWKDGMERKGLRVNMKKTKLLVSGSGLNILKDSGTHPCAVCRSGVGSNSIQCTECRFWVHKKCCGIQGKLVNNPDYRCPRCLGLSRPIDGRPITEVAVNGTNLEVEASFCYLGDMICAGGGCGLAITTRCCTAWGKFKKLLPILTSKHISLLTRGKVFNTCVRAALLHASETWAPNATDLQKLRRNDRAMIRWICGTKPLDETPSQVLCNRLGIPEVINALRERRLRWYGHVMRSSSCINTVTSLKVSGRGKRGRPRKTWSQCIQDDLAACNLTDSDALNRITWRTNLRRSSRLLPTSASGMPAADDK